MTDVEIGRLIYLTILGGALLSYLVLSHRRSLGTLARGAVLWGLIFVGVIAAYGLWDGVRDQVAGPSQTVAIDTGRVEVPRSADGHYYLRLEVNGAPVRFVVDTGATDIVLSRADAARVGIDLDALNFTGVARTANGTVRTARVRLDEVSLDGITDRNVTAWVNEGELDISLLGMSYLSRFDRIEIERNRLVLVR